jgi:hypothetical protein
MCPICNQAEGIIWDEEGLFPEHAEDGFYNKGNVEPMLKGEEGYDWNCLDVERGNHIDKIQSN